MSFSGPMRRPSSMTRAMVEKMIAQQQQQQQQQQQLQGSHRLLQLQTSAGRSGAQAERDGLLHGHTQCSPRSPSVLGWPAGFGLREINTLWEMAAQQGSSVSNTAAAVGMNPSASLSSTAVGNTVLGKSCVCACRWLYSL